MGMHHIGIVQSNNVKVIFKISCKVQNWLGLMFRVRVMCSHHVKVQHFKENLQLFMCSTSKVQDGHSMSLACLQKVYLCRWCTLAYKYYHHICNREREKYDGWIWFDQRLGPDCQGDILPLHVSEIAYTLPISACFCRMLFCRSRTAVMMEEKFSFRLSPWVIRSCVHQCR